MTPLLLLLACAAKTPPAPAAAPALPPDCPRGVEDPVARLAEGEALIEASMVGEHPVGWDYLWGLQAVGEAADAGYAPALYRWGHERFSLLYMDRAPDPDNTAERQAYILALAALGHAARLGHPDAQTALPPDLMAALLDPVGPVPDAPNDDEVPLADLPREWLESARQVVDHHRRCWSDP